MKKAIQITTLLITAIFYSQSVSDFKYILVPEKFRNEKANKYDLNILLTSKLKAKKFVVFNEAFENRPAGSEDPCKILKAEVTDTSNMFTNKARVEFKDCNDKTVATFDGKSSIKEFDEGMRAALVASLNNLSPSNPVNQNLVAKQESIPSKTVQQENIKIPISDSDTSLPESLNISGKNKPSNQTVGAIVKAEDIAPKAENYSNGNLFLNKVNLGNGEFILLNPENSIPYATFKPSSKKDTFHVQLQNETSTLGYLEEGKIIVEIPNADGTFTTEIFERK